MTIGLQSLSLRPGHPDFLDLPWDVPLEEWPADTRRVVQLERGLSRHPVRFVGYEQGIYALKEMPPGVAEREYDLLRALEDRRLPAVLAVGHAATRTADDTGASVLVTRYLDGSLPYRTLFMNQGLARYRERLLDAMAGLLVRLHVAGVYWGDCSLSNTLFRRDAGELQACLVDAETSHVYDTLSEGQRHQDLIIMEENIAGELADVALAMELPQEFGQHDTGQSIRSRYDRLWSEIVREEIISPAETYRIHERVRALNELGFSVGEIELLPAPNGSQLRVRTIVTDRLYHHHLLHSLTGVVAQERQAALLVSEIREMRATMADQLGRSAAMSEAAHRWRRERYEPAVRKLSSRVRFGLDEPELYCQVLEHKWYLSEHAKRDVGFQAALDDYLANVAGA